MPEILTLESARAVYKLGRDMEEADLRELVEREERYLARLIGPLTGNLVQTFTGGGYARLYLRRYVSAITTITDYGTAVDAAYYAFTAPNIIDAGDYFWTGPVIVTAPLDDRAVIEQLVADLVALRTSGHPAHDSESGNDYSYSNAVPVEVRRRNLIADALPGRGI